MRSDMEMFFYGGVVAATLSFIALIAPSKRSQEENPLKNSFIFLWIERKKLEERKRIEELKK